MKGIVRFLLVTSFLMLLTACSSADEEKASQDKQVEVNDSAQYSDEQEKSEKEAPAEESTTEETTERKIIHTAMLSTNVKDLSKAQNNIEQKVKKYGGYIVESNVYQEDEQTSSGKMTVRIPEQHFETFISDAEGEASKVLERNVTGQDVTEQFVDLEARIKSKRAVEERLLDFMKNAEKTEDLLKISSDLATIQEEIEVMVGRMKYLENQTSFSTIELTMFENRIIVPGLDGEELNTWERTKKQFVTSMNGILSGGSALVIFLLGNSPAFLLLGAIGVGGFLIYKRWKQQKQEK